MDKDPYDGPEDESTTWGRGIALLVGAVAVIAIFWAIVNTDVFL